MLSAPSLEAEGEKLELELGVSNPTDEPSLTGRSPAHSGKRAVSSFSITWPPPRPGRISYRPRLERIMPLTHPFFSVRTTWLSGSSMTWPRQVTLPLPRRSKLSRTRYSTGPSGSSIRTVLVLALTSDESIATNCDAIPALDLSGRPGRTDTRSFLGWAWSPTDISHVNARPARIRFTSGLCVIARFLRPWGLQPLRATAVRVARPDRLRCRVDHDDGARQSLTQ